MMDQRRNLVLLVRDEGVSVAEAARRHKVSRDTAYRWLKRSEEMGLAGMAEKSRRPHNIRPGIDESVERAILAHKAEQPTWGAKKIRDKAWPVNEGQTAPVSQRTCHRILQRHELVKLRTPIQLDPWIRFEREVSNLLWQMDFKGMGRKGPGYYPLSIIDDHSRFCLAFTPCARQTGELVFEVLWRVFEHAGLPEAILTDNGSCFSGTHRLGVSWLESKLWLLGVDTRHGRPYHPQTQGKVERFHKTVAVDLDTELRQPTQDKAAAVYESFRNCYNWERPHEALGMKRPGQVWQPSLRERPSKMPVHELDEGCLKRKVHPNGDINFDGTVHRISGGLAGEWVQLNVTDKIITVFYAKRQIAELSRVRPRQRHPNMGRPPL